MTRDSAQRIVDATLEATAALHRAIAVLRETLGHAEAQPYVLVAASASYDLYDQILRPVVNEHPEVRPDGFPIHPRDPRLVVVPDPDPSDVADVDEDGLDEC